MALTLRRTTATAKYYTEPLDVLGDAIPLQMLLIPGGTFTMGSPDDELERSDSEGLQHDVIVPQFFMGRYPVTQAQWQAVAALPQIEQELAANPSEFKGANRPVEQVSWYDAMEFCKRLSIHTGRPYRLPSEAEWEYACRAGTTTPFHFGKTLISEVANYDSIKFYGDDGTLPNSDLPSGEYRQETTFVNHFDVANDFGLCDMHGNVLEWCQDIWHDSYEGAPTDGSAWTTNGNDKYRILRGGSWAVESENCRSACRITFQPNARDSMLGFRVVSTPTGSLT
ncbi:MAG: formylglycine-generating enzyme family protein [Leptolyngbyaceae cyanobacterium]